MNLIKSYKTIKFKEIMFKIHKEEIEVNGKKLTETGKIARQADGAIIASLGETVVITTAVGAKKVADGQDYFPLSVNYQEKYYAAGKIPGGCFKEARPTGSETLISRLIDSLSGLFPSGFMNEVQFCLQFYLMMQKINQIFWQLWHLLQLWLFQITIYGANRCEQSWIQRWKIFIKSLC